jgi:MFS family permease
VLHAAAQTFVWIVVFFFASAGASAGYLTVSEIFPIEIRAEALAVFFAIAQIVGAVGPAFYGALIGLAWGINAEGKSLEDIALPLTAVRAKEAGAR